MGWSLPLYSLWATNNGPCAHHALLLELLQMLVQTAVLSVHVKVQAVSLNHKVLLDSNTEQHTYSKDSSGVNMTHTNTQTCTHTCTHAHTNTHACIHKTHTHTLHACTHAECQQHSHVSYLSGELRNSLHLFLKLGLLTTLKCLNSLLNTFILNNAGEHQIEPASTRRPLSQWEAAPTNLTLSSCKVFSNLFILPEVLCSLLAVSLSLMLQTR